MNREDEKEKGKEDYITTKGTSVDFYPTPLFRH